MITLEQQIYEFDVNGYVVIKGALSKNHAFRLEQYWDNRLLSESLHDIDLNWGSDWRELIDNEAVLSVLNYLFKSKFRLDHMFCADERFISSQGILHHHADMVEEGIFYRVTNNTIFNGLTGVQFALTKIDAAVNHFCCIPGSHSANFPVPDIYKDHEQNPLIKHVYLEASDALIFSEALVHGTFAVQHSGKRRSIFARYTNSYSYYRRPPQHLNIEYLPPTPNHAKDTSKKITEEFLTGRQRSLVTEPAYARGHRPVSKQ